MNYKSAYEALSQKKTATQKADALEQLSETIQKHCSYTSSSNSQGQRLQCSITGLNEVEPKDIEKFTEIISTIPEYVTGFTPCSPDMPQWYENDATQEGFNGERYTPNPDIDAIAKYLAEQNLYSE